MEIQPGSTVQVKIKSQPRSTAARKTLARVFLKDDTIRKSRIQVPKYAKSKRRGGRDWFHTKRGSVAITPKVGDCANIFATLDVIRDLDSVSRHIELL